MTAPVLVLVHGRAQEGQDPDVLKRDWVDALRRGLGQERSAILSRIEIRFPYYGDKLDGFVRQAEESLPADIIVRGDPVGADAAYLKFETEFANEIYEDLGLTAAQVDAQLSEEARERGPLNWEWIQGLMRAADAIPGVSARSIERFTRDVYLYLSRSLVRKDINKIVDDAIPATKAIVVGHSLGSVVAYDTLRTATRAIDVPLLVTVGSPLGVGPILRTLTPLRFPGAVKSWFNALDDRDVVALVPLDEARFPVEPPIVNYTDVRNRTENAHGISGYLDDSIVAQRIYDALTSIE